MIDIVKNYYKAWEEHDINALKQVIHPLLFGVRTFNEEKYFTAKDLFKAFTKLDKIEITHSKEKVDSIEYEFIINNKTVVAKATIKDEKIYKVYEQYKTSKNRFKCVVSYDGSSYSGYQKQLNAKTVQGTIETAIKQSFKLEDITIHSSGRTDKGVHAYNQVFHFDIKTSIKPQNITMMLNSYLPDSIFIKSCVEVSQTHHARYDVKRKQYLYKINLNEYSPIQRNYEWFVRELDVETFNTQLSQVIGTHDFTSFTKSNELSNIRTIYQAESMVKDGILYVYLEGNGFLRYMVRNLMGAMVSYTKGKQTLEIKELLEKKDVTLNKDKAPAAGLYLNKVVY